MHSLIIISSSLHCILTLVRAINQRFSVQDALVKISRSSYVVECKYVGFMKWDIQIPMWDTINVSLCLKSIRGTPASDWAYRCGSGPPWASVWVLPDREAKVLNGALKTACYGQSRTITHPFSVIPRTPIFEPILLLCSGYSQLF